MKKLLLESIEFRLRTSLSLAMIFSLLCTLRTKIDSKITMIRFVFIIYYKLIIVKGKHLWAIRVACSGFFRECCRTSRFCKGCVFLIRNSFREYALNTQCFMSSRSPKLVQFAHLWFLKIWYLDRRYWWETDYHVFQNWVRV